jgi:hypothetical protein
MEGGDAQQFYSEQQYFDQSEFQMSTTIPDEDENSFDPSDFFMHSALATEAQQQLQHGVKFLSNHSTYHLSFLWKLIWKL